MRVTVHLNSLNIEVMFLQVCYAAMLQISMNIHERLGSLIPYRKKMN